jgi:phosphatidylserine/phosphatidylglycerophosphate/cardiolipin synthase-like enzyme
MRHTLILFAMLSFWLCAIAQAAEPTPAVEVHFSPNGGCTDAICKLIDGAQSEILVACYSFTSQPIERSLAAAVKRGVKVRMIQDQPSTIQAFALYGQAKRDGVDVHYDAAHAIAHSKYMVFDGTTVETGSFNFTTGAERSNAENVVTVRDKAIAAAFIANWQAHLSHADRPRPARK